MPSRLIAHWEKPPELEIRLNDTFPLAESTRCSKAFKDKEPKWEMLREHYGPEGIYINYNTPLEWKEIILSFNGGDLEEAVKRYVKNGPLVLEGAKLDSFTLQAQVSGIMIDSSYSRTGLFCFTQSPDKTKLIMGIRGGSSNIGRMLSSPVGHAGYKETTEYGDQITDAIILEGEEEMGVREYEIETLAPIGVFRQMGDCAPGNIFFYISQLKIPTEEVVERHTEAMRKYKMWKEEKDGNKTEKEIYVRQKMKQVAKTDNSFPFDAWENERLITIPNDPNEIIGYMPKIAELDDMVGSLALYFLHEFGQREYEKLMDAPGMRKRIEERL